MQWEILPDSKVVLGYSCRKATCVFKGRTWNAWFTTDIPYSEGPWKFCGLPGLILQVEDERGWFSFICNAISNSKRGYSDDGRSVLSAIYMQGSKTSS
jgi:Protein of unknown function (Porph_ging).